jgi:glycosyltransferase involved in cell wall biosynthesis
VARTSWPIAVFAHNEEPRITACLDALLTEPLEGRELEIHVLVNGCTDGTWAQVERYARHHPQVKPWHLELGDKNNAWNMFVHEFCPPGAEIVFFMDGDVQVVRGSLLALQRKMQESPEAQAVAALPFSGRSADAFRDTIIHTHAIAGGLYALRGSLVDRFREVGLRIPIRMFGDDGLLRTLILRDLDPRGAENLSRITYAEQAGFSFDKLSPWKPHHWIRYRNRMRRYANRRLHNRMLYPHLLREGLSALPANIYDLADVEADKLTLEWNGVMTVFDFLALRALKRQVAQRRAERASRQVRASQV